MCDGQMIEPFSPIVIQMALDQDAVDLSWALVFVHAAGLPVLDLRLQNSSKPGSCQPTKVYLRGLFWSLLVRNQLHLFGSQDGLGAATHAELAMDVVGVLLDRANRQEKLIRYLLVGEARCDEPEDF